MINALVLQTRPLFGLISASKSICPRHPDLLKGSHQAAGGYQLHRHFSPSEVLSELPPLVATVLSRTTLWPDRSIIIPIACHRCTGSPPVFPACCLSLPADRTNQRPIINEDGVLLFPSGRFWRSRWRSSCFEAKAIGTCLMNGYSVFKVPPHPSLRRKWVKGFCPFTL